MGLLAKLFGKSNGKESNRKGLNATIDKATDCEDLEQKMQCTVCSKPIKAFHYSFESIILSQLLGIQCSECGVVYCIGHLPDNIKNTGDPCPKCKGRVVFVEEGPALSSMVDQAKKNGQYNTHIRRPDSVRPVEQD